MILAGAQATLPAFGAAFRERWALHPHYGIFDIRMRGCVNDEHVIGSRGMRRRPQRGRAVLFSVASGEMFVRFDDRSIHLRAGEAVLVRRPDVFLRWISTDAADFRMTALGLSLDRFDPLAPRDPIVVSTSRSTQDAHRRLRTTLGGGERRAVAAALAEWLAALRSEGVMREPADERTLVAPVNDTTQRLAAAMARVSLDPARSAGIVDLARETGTSIRHVSRMQSQFTARFMTCPVAVKEVLVRSRIQLGAMFMTATRATTEGVSRFLGYSDPTSFCRLLDNIDLPSPSVLARKLRAGG